MYLLWKVLREESPAKCRQGFLAMSLLHPMLPGAGEGGRQVGKFKPSKVSSERVVMHSQRPREVVESLYSRTVKMWH